MNLIIPPVQSDSKSIAIKNIHYMLFFFKLQLNHVEINKLFDDPAFISAYSNEVFDQKFGKATSILVSVLQKILNIKKTTDNVIEKLTADKFNELLRQFGGLDIEKPEGYPFEIKDDTESKKQFTIAGHLMFKDNKPAAAFTVVAYNKNLRSEIEIGKSETARTGEFKILYEPVFQKREYKTADLFFKIFRGKTEIKDFILVEIAQQGKNEIKDSILFNAGENTVVEIILPADVESKGPSEFEEIASNLFPLLEETKIEELNENQAHKDFTFLAGETGLDKNKIIRFALSHRMQLQSKIDAEFWYALTSGNFYLELSKSFSDQNLDSNLPKIIVAFFALSANDINEIVKQSLASNLISSTLAERLPKWIKQFSQFIIKRMGSLPKEDPSPYLKTLMNSAGLGGDKQTKFLGLYFNHGVIDEAFWKQVSKNKGFEEIEVKKLQFTHSLTKLAGNNEKLVNLAAALPRIGSMRDLALKHGTDSLAKLLTAEMLPTDVEGNTTKAKIKNYSSLLQKKLFEKETSAVLQRMTIAKELPIKEDSIRKGVADFFNNHPEFNIRQKSIYHVIKNKDAFNGIAEKNKEEVVSQLKTLQRVQAISPTPEAVATMMKANINTAHQITEIPEANFIAAFSKKMGEEVARQVYANATNVKLRNEHTLISMKEAVQGTGIAFVDGDRSREERKVDFDTKAVESGVPVRWENLFGSVDFCECAECTSVFSPAAYFVELLQYLRNGNLDPAATGVQAFRPDAKDISGTVLEKLFRRRPDLGCLELTCANTNTILPYVDLVNEVMESFIVHLNAYSTSVLNPKQATIDPWNVEDETSGELLAQPQHINNDAYLELKKAVYPFALPYDRPVDMIRIFLQYLDSSRYELMKTFRAVDQNTIAKEVMPEDTVLPVSPSPDPDEDKVPAFNSVVSDRAIDAEFLSITQEEYVILTKEAFLSKKYFSLRTPGITDGQYRSQIGVKEVPEYYGYAGATGKADMLSTNETLQIGLTFVKKQFLKRTGLLYADLIELLKTESLNPLYPKGKALVILKSIPFSYRFLQGFVDKNNIDPEKRLAKVIDVLANPQNYIPGYNDEMDYNPCKPPETNSRPAFRSANIKQWVLCYFERIGKMIVLENNVPDCDCVEGQFFRRGESDTIQILDTEGQLFLTKGCDLVLKRRGSQVTVGHVDSMTGFISLTDRNGKPIDTSVLTRQSVIFNGNMGESGSIDNERLVDKTTRQPFTCKQIQTDTCDLNNVRLKHLDGTDLSVLEYDKIHRFVRLWRKMNWTIDETDKAVVGLTADQTTFTNGFQDSCEPEVDPKGFAEITPDLLHQLVAVKKLLDKTGLDLIKLLSFWADINTSGEKSLYKRLFLTHNLMAIDDVFKADANDNYLTKPEKLVDHIPVLMAAFNLKSEDIDALVSVSDPLTLQTVSEIYRHSLVAKLLHVKTVDLNEIFVLFNDPFQNAEKALDFFDKWDRLEAAGFTFEQLNYVIQDNDNPLKPIKPSRNSILKLAKVIYDGLNGIEDAHPDLSVLDEATIKMLSGLTSAGKKDLLRKIATEELVRSKVSLLFDQESVEAVMGMLQGSNVYSTTVPASLVTTVDEFRDKFPNSTPAEKLASTLLFKKISYDFISGTLQVTGILTAKEIIVCKGLFSKAAWKSAFDTVNDQALSIFNDLFTGIFAKNIPAARTVLLEGDVKNPGDNEKDTAPIKREYFLERFLPYLRQKLTEKFLIETLAGETDLETDVAGVLMREILEGASSKKIMEIFKDAKISPASGTIGWKGYLIPTTDENYEFSVKTSAAAFSLRLDGDTIVDETTAPVNKLFVSVPIRLKAGRPYLFEVAGLTAELNNISWTTPVSVRTLIPAMVLLPASAVAEVEEGLIKLLKAAIVVNNLELAADEITWIQNHAVDFDGLDFNAITLLHLMRMEAFIRLRDSLPESEIKLIDFIKWTYTVSTSTIPSEKIALLIGRKKEEIDDLIEPVHFNLMKPKDFSSEINLLKLQNALFLFDKINMKLDLLFEWARPVSQFAICQSIAERIRKSIQARYKQEDWERVVKPLNDTLREHQKQALINYLLVQPELINWGIIDADSLFEFFLIDVQMDSCMQTSRIKQAISSVQLFIQRCCLGLEAHKGVPNDVLDRERLKWMQRNPLWVANRKVFLYTENLLITGLRDDKSPFFKELESELLQKDISKQNVEDALRSYLSKLDEIANMKVIGLFIEESVTGKLTAGDKVHIFSSTRTAPYSFYYRHYKTDERNWMPWEKLQVDIPSYDRKDENQEITGSGCYLIPIVFGKRLFVLFPQMTEKTRPNEKSKDKTVSENAGAAAADVRPTTYWQIKMAWSEYRNGKWSQKQICDDVIYHPDGGPGDLSLVTHPNGDINRYSFVPDISPSNNYFNIVIYYDRIQVNNSRYSHFLFMDGNLKKQTSNLTTSNSGYPDNFHYGSNSIASQIHSLQKDSAFGYESKSPFFSDDSSRELYHNADNTVASFYYPYVPELLKKIQIDDLTDFFSFNLTIKDQTSTSSFNELLEAFGKEPSGISHELKSPHALYNWELFFYIPVAIAQKLSASNKFEEAMKWYHYVFDPTAKGLDPKRFWQFLPFKEINAASLVDTLFNVLQPNTPNNEINEWRNQPFQPHVIARSRPLAYMKWVVMGYIDNLIAWGDYLFKQDTIETVNYATQLYVLAGHILGPRPQVIPRRGKIKPETYNSLLDKWDAFSNAKVELELIAPFSNQISSATESVGGKGDVQTANIFGFASTLYFCIPTNPKLMAYWATLADRLFKIRHCENIEGVFRMLPLWDPPIDPALLVAATAQGLNLDSVLKELNTPLPNFRFSYLIQKAIELCNEVKSLGNSLLSVLEKKDGELLAKMRAGHEASMHNLVMEVKKLQVEESYKALEGLEQNRLTTEYRLRHYLQLVGQDLSKVPSPDKTFSEVDNQLEAPIDESGLKLISEEKEEMDKAAQALGWQIASSGVEVLSSLSHILPDATISVMPLGLGLQTHWGGTNLGFATSAVSKVLQTISSIYSYESTSAQRKAGFRRQLQDRILQANLAGYECKQIDKQIVSQKIRINISEREITNQQAMIDNAVEVEDFLKNKYSNEELYEWMQGSIKAIYHQVYSLAHDLAKKAEQIYRFERGLSNSTFIQYGYWDTSRDGLQAGERLFLGLKQMEAAYNENRGHDFEVTKHISLQQLDPMALIELRETGQCEFNIPEVLFDIDFPGHYMRKIRSVALSIPCIAGPYTSVNATLRLLEHKYRISPVATNKKDYLQKIDEEDPRFLTAHVPIDSIATSSGQHDNGVFELNFKDERYMPFEGAGVISKWQLKLPSFRQFKYESIANVIMDILYIAKDGGSKLERPASDALMDYFKSIDELSQREGLFAMFDLKNDFPNEWYKAMNVAPGVAGRSMDLGNLSERLPYYTKNANIKNIKAKDIYFALDASFKITDLTVMHASNPLTVSFEGPEKLNTDINLFHLSELDKSMNKIADTWTLKFANSVKELNKMMMVVRYTLQT